MKGIIRHLPWIIGILLISGIVLLPLARAGFPVTDDGDWMIIRLSAFYQSLREGQFPVRFLGRLNYQFGYPVSNFLYPGFLYLGSLIHVLGLSFVMTVKCILASSVIIGALAIYIALFEYSPFIRTVAALSFVFSPYVYYDLYKRGSVGEVLAMSVALLSFMSLKRGWLWMFAPLMGFLILSHNSLFLILGGFLLLKLVTTKNIQFLKSYGLGVGMAAFFWIPALVEQRYVRFNTIMVSDPTKYFISMFDASFIGLSTIFSFIITVYFFIKRKQKEKKDIVLFIISFIAVYILVTPVSFPLWNIPAFSRLFQFPYRFLSILVIIAPALISYCLNALEKRLSMLFGVVMIMLMIYQIVSMMPAVIVENKTEGFYTTNEATTTVADEYMPRWVSAIPKQRAYERMIIYSGQGNIIINTKTFQNLRATIHTDEPSVIQLNYVYYPGWGISVNGLPVKIHYDNPEGFMRFSVPKGTFTVLAQFRETPFRFVIDTVSGICIIVWFIVYMAIFLKQRFAFHLAVPTPVRGKHRVKRT